MVVFFGNHRSKDGCVYARPRKQYTRNHPYPTGTAHIKPALREKAAILKLCKKGYSINQLAKAFGRSTSFIHRIARNAISLLCLRKVDKRKLPSRTRLLTSCQRWKMLMKFLPSWEAWIFGEVDKPP